MECITVSLTAPLLYLFHGYNPLDQKFQFLLPILLDGQTTFYNLPRTAKSTTFFYPNFAFLVCCLGVNSCGCLWAGVVLGVWSVRVVWLSCGCSVCYVVAMCLLCACYVVGGVLTLKISKKKNENVTGSILIWATIILLPLVSFIEQPWQVSPRTDSLISVIYLGIVPTGIAWLLRFKILKENGLIFQSQVSYLIPIFGTILGYIFLQELITIKVLISLTAVCIGIYFVRRADIKKLS